MSNWYDGLETQYAYGYDDNGYYVGQVVKQPSPLEDNTWLLPANATDTDPGTPGADKEHKWNGSSWDEVTSRAKLAADQAAQDALDQAEEEKKSKGAKSVDSVVRQLNGKIDSVERKTDKKFNETEQERDSSKSKVNSLLRKNKKESEKLLQKTLTVVDDLENRIISKINKQSAINKSVHSKHDAKHKRDIEKVLEQIRVSVNSAIRLHHNDMRSFGRYVRQYKYNGSKISTIKKTLGGAQTEEFNIPGVKDKAVCMVTMNTEGASPVTVISSRCEKDKVIVKFSADPSTDHEINITIH